MSLVLCADVGSTFTKVALVDVAGGELLATAARATTAGTDVLHGLDEAVAAVTADRAVPVALPWYVCSSAGGGLRLAVLGYQELITARAGRQVGLSAGAHVVHVGAGRLDVAALAAVRAARPDVVLLVGGTDGGDGAVLLHNAARLAAARWRVPVVVAGNCDVRDEAVAALAGRGVPVSAADNVLPRIGVLDAEPARAVIRAVFLRHVIGGKRLSRGARFPSLVRAATPDAVLDGVRLLADVTGVDLLVVDVGGATTDVYSAVTPDPERCSGPRRAAAGTLWRSRSVEGDLGVRAGAPGVVAAAAAERLGADDVLAAAAARRAACPDLLPDGPVDAALDRRLAGLAVTLALRRHARGDGDGGRDLRSVALVVGSGGVWRHADPAAATAALAAAVADHAGGWPVPQAARVLVDRAYVLAAAGLLAGAHPDAAATLLRRHFPTG